MQQKLKYRSAETDCIKFIVTLDKKAIPFIQGCFVQSPDFRVTIWQPFYLLHSALSCL